MTPRLAESDLGPPVVAWLQEHGWTVYEEVHDGGLRADLVAAMGRLRWAIELKAYCKLDVIEQACHWLGHAHYVSVATPSTGSNLWQAVLRWKGIGLFTVERGVFGKLTSDSCAMRIEPSLCRRVLPKFNNLREEQRARGRAGTATSDYWTPYRHTCRLLLAYVNEHPGCSIKQAVAAIEHHYATGSTARSALLTWIRAGKVPGVRSRAEGRRFILEPVSQPLTATAT